MISSLTHTACDSIFVSTGGIISLGFAAKQWSVDTCIKEFKTMVKQVFVPRSLNNVPVVKYISTIRGKYKTTPLIEALRETFGESILFGNFLGTCHTPLVAVTATEETYKGTIMLGSYRREDTRHSKRRRNRYDFPRPDSPDLELKLWEAAAATSAASTYFKAFYHAPTKRTYVDGAVYHNNPVRVVNEERKLLWPDVADRHLDILLSVGTGQHDEEVDRELPREHKENVPVGGKEELRRPAELLSTKRNPYTRRRKTEFRDAQSASWTPFARLKQMYTAMV